MSFNMGLCSCVIFDFSFDNIETALNDVFGRYDNENKTLLLVCAFLALSIVATP